MDHICFSSKTAVKSCCVLIRFSIPLFLLLFLCVFRFTSMAVHAVRLPATQIHGGISANLSPSNRKPNSVLRFGCGYSNRRRFVAVSASLRENDEHGRDNSVRSMEVKKILEDSPLLPSTDSIFPSFQSLSFL